MFREQDEDCVFMETCMRLNHFPHMAIECIPLPRELGDMAPIYFKASREKNFDTDLMFSNVSPLNASH